MGFLLTLPAVIGSVLGGYVYQLNPKVPWFLLALALIFNSILAFLLKSGLGLKDL